jgi:hypothetical protein
MIKPFPIELNYLQPMIQQFPSELLYYATGDAFAASLSRASIAQFAAYYDELGKKGDDATISKCQ